MGVIDRNKYVLRQLSERYGHRLGLFHPQGTRYATTCRNPGCDGYAIVAAGSMEGNVVDRRCPIKEE